LALLQQLNPDGENPNRAAVGHDFNGTMRQEFYQHFIQKLVSFSKKLKERSAVWESTFVFEWCIAVLLGRVGILLGVVNPLRKDPDFLNSGHILLVIRRLLDIRLL
jgi:hypothetical protein